MRGSGESWISCLRGSFASVRPQQCYLSSGYLLFGIVLLALLPLELSSVLGTGLPFNYGFLKIIMASYPREYLDAIMAYSGALIAFLSAMLLYFVLLFLYAPKRLRICWKWSPLIICALFGIMVASYWTVTAFSGTTKHYADYNRSYLGVAKVAVITSFPLKYLLLFYAHQTAKEIENHVIRERLGFIDTISVTAEKPDSIVGLFLSVRHPERAIGNLLAIIV